MQREGITVAGSIIVDQHYAIQEYPSAGELSQIQAMLGRSTGGALCNDIMALAKLAPDIPLQAVGKIGDDENGQLVLDTFKQYPSIDVSQISYQDATGYTLVMNDQSTKERTFFSYMGANSFLEESDFDTDKITGRLFHIGYISLLAALDRADNEYGTALAKLLHRLQEAGIKTSIDVVSDAAQRYRLLMQSALKYTDYCIINELEAQGVTGIQLRDKAGNLHTENFEAALFKLRELGVGEWVVIHAPEIGFGIDRDDQMVSVDVDMLAKNQIVDSVGAGDAFCSGVLLGAYRGRSLEEAIKIGILAARYSLQGHGAVGNLAPLETLQSV